MSKDRDNMIESNNGDDMETSSLSCSDINKKLDKMEARLLIIEAKNHKNNRIRNAFLFMLILLALGTRFSVSGTINGIKFEGGKDDHSSNLADIVELLLNIGVIGVGGYALNTASKKVKIRSPFVTANPEDEIQELDEK